MISFKAYWWFFYDDKNTLTEATFNKTFNQKEPRKKKRKLIEFIRLAGNFFSLMAKNKKDLTDATKLEVLINKTSKNEIE